MAYPTACVTVTLSPKTIMLTTTMPIFLTCPAALNVNEPHVCITPSVVRITKNPSAATAKYGAGLLTTFIKFSGFRNSVSSNTATPTHRKKKLAGQV